MSNDFYTLLIPLIVIPLGAVAVVCVVLYVKARWEGHKARERAEGRGDHR